VVASVETGEAPAAVGESPAQAPVNQAPMAQVPATQPQYSADGKYWWDGSRWTAVAANETAP
jgi:hypothetical protein